MMKSIFLFFIASSSAFLQSVAKDKKKPASGYLEHTLPSTLAFRIDPLPADRLMLVTKAPTIPTDPVFLKSGPDANQTVTALPVSPIPPVAEVIDPPPVIVPSLSVLPSASGPVAVTPIIPKGAAVVMTDDLLELLEMEGKNPFDQQPRIIVPFEMPFAQTPAVPVLNSKARYIKRWK